MATLRPSPLFRKNLGYDDGMSLVCESKLSKLMQNKDEVFLKLFSDTALEAHQKSHRTQPLFLNRMYDSNGSFKHSCMCDFPKGFLLSFSLVTHTVESNEIVGK
jgi:hypothetical protein